MKMFGYLFVYFAGEKYEDGEQIYFAVSKDGLNWDDLNQNRPVLTSSLGEIGVRDPFIIRSATENKFYLIATDLKIHGDWNWTRSNREGSKSLMQWESEDLINWSEQKMIPVSVEDAGCTWAPEAMYDKESGDYLVYWASTRAATDFSQQIVYCSRTKDFTTYTKPEVYIERENKHILDTTMIEHEGVYYRYSNDGLYECISCEQMKDIMGADAMLVPSPLVEEQRGVEGPFAFKFNDEDKWCLLLDECGGIGYYPLITDDLASGEYQKLEDGYRLPARARHGSVISITEEEYNKLLQKWGTM